MMEKETKAVISKIGTEKDGLYDQGENVAYFFSVDTHDISPTANQDNHYVNLN